MLMVTAAKQDMPVKSAAPMPRQKLEWVSLRAGLKKLKSVFSGDDGPDRRTPVLDARKPGKRSFIARLKRRRWLFTFLVALTTLAGTLQLASVLQTDGVTYVEIGLISIFGLLFSWIAISFWVTFFGLLASRRGAKLDNLVRPNAAQVQRTAGRSKTALVMPIYNEDVPRVFAGLEAVCDSLCDSNGKERFDVFILSDSNDPECYRKEREYWRALRGAMAGRINIYYRRRTENKGRKSGNIEEFCKNWGSAYDYMIVLDADSVMTGVTLRRLVRLMDANGNVGLIQAPPAIVGASSLFARFQQFASSVYGPVFAKGLAYLQGPDGNYWGHNAIIRVRAFMANCGLPILPGKAPLGGEILSHDFVEAALLRRGGWEVWMVPDLGGSFEEIPQTVDDYLARDRRWCQGNLQHARLVPMRGLRMASRLHFVMGVMSYVSSPLWLVMLFVSIAQAYYMRDLAPFTFSGAYPILNLPISHVEELVLLVSATFLILFGPKIFGFLALLMDRQKLAAHGGVLKVFAGVLCESVFSVLFAPIAMLAHSWFVLNNLAGRSVGWNAQPREGRNVPIMAVARSFSPHTVIGIVFGFVAYFANPESIWWLVPFLAGLTLAVPVVYLVCGSDLSKALKRANLLQTPIELSRDSIVERVKRLTEAAKAGYALRKNQNGWHAMPARSAASYEA